MTSEQISISDARPLAGDDIVLPFQVDPLDVRGRAVFLGEALDNLLSRHDYPEPVSALLGQMAALTILLGSSLKFDGNFILQTQSAGPVSLAVVDFSTPDSVRAYARFDAERVEAAIRAGEISPREMLGEGVLAMTVDQGADMQRYQGIVALDGISLEEAAHQYFKQSEQIPTIVRLAVAKIVTPNPEGNGSKTAWRAGGIISQFLPDSPERIKHVDLPGGSDDEEFSEVEHDDAWNEARALVETVADDELTDPQLGVEQLLYRLFHEHGVRAYEGTPVKDKCTCSRERVIAMIKNFADEPDHEPEDVETKCEFCGTIYNIAVSELA